MPYSKANAVPAADSASNVTMRDVIGNKDDTHDGTSLVAVTERMDEHVHSPQKVYPDHAAAVAVATETVAYTDGALTEIVPVSTITTQFDIHWIEATMSANAEYQLDIYEATTLRGSVALTRNTNQVRVGAAPMQTILFAANSQVQGRLSSDTADVDAANVRLLYHEYP